MKVEIEFDLDIYHGDNEDSIHDLLADMDYTIRTDKRVTNYNIFYDVKAAFAE